MAEKRLRRVSSQPENPFGNLIPNQSIAIVPSFTLESGVTLQNLPVAYSTRGKLSPERDNAMVICHALSGSADVSDWWGPLLGKTGKAFDITRFFVICINSLGSPYGTASPVTVIDGDPEKGQYGPEFPLTTIRDDVRLAKILLDDLNVRQIAAVIGGSMGGMLVLEYAYLGKDYVRTIIPIATSARHSAWCISWGEAQRQNIFSDPKYEDGYYLPKDPPATGLGAARMAALLTYRSRDSFESRFGRNVPDARKHPGKVGSRPSTPADDHFAIHNEGHKLVGNVRSPRQSINGVSTPPTGQNSPSTHAAPELPAPNDAASSKAPNANSASSINTANNTNDVNTQHDNDTEPQTIEVLDPEVHGATPVLTPVHRSPLAAQRKKATTYFSAQSYLRYQGEKFISRFDANCYISITRKLDTHDVSYHGPDGALHGTPEGVWAALALIQQPTLVLGIESDGLFTFAEQREIAENIPGARLGKIESMEGHDAFLLQFEQVNRYILDFLTEKLPDIMAREPMQVEDEDSNEGLDGKVVKNSVFGEAEVEDITAW